MVDKITWDEVKKAVLSDAKIGHIATSGYIEWRLFFDKRQMQEIAFDKIYADQFAHGTDGHNARLIIARMADLLDVICASIPIEVTND